MEILKDYINGSWVESQEKRTRDVVNPASQEMLAKVPFGDKNISDAEWA